MFKFDRALLLLLMIGLTSCGSQQPVNAARLPASAITDTPTNSGPGTATVAPTATATDEPPTPTPDIPVLYDGNLKSQVDRLASGFLNSSKNPGLSVSVVLRDPASGQLKAMLLNYGTIYKDSGNSVDSGTVYELGSITKLFTGILLAEAVNAGEVKLSDPIQDYLPTGIAATSAPTQAWSAIQPGARMAFRRLPWTSLPAPGRLSWKALACASTASTRAI